MSKDKGTSTTDMTPTESNHKGNKGYSRGQHPNSKATQFDSDKARELQKKSVESRKNNSSLRDSFIAKGGLLPEEFLYGIMNDENASPSVRMKAAEKLIDFTQPKLSSIQQKTEVSQVPSFQVNVKKKLSPEDAKKISKVIDKETDEDTEGDLGEPGEK